MYLQICQLPSNMHLLNNGNPLKEAKLEALMQHVENINFDVGNLRIISLLWVR